MLRYPQFVVTASRTLVFFSKQFNTYVQRTLVRDGPLENLWGGGGAGEVQKKYSRKGNLNEKTFFQLILKNIDTMA